VSPFLKILTASAKATSWLGEEAAGTSAMAVSDTAQRDQTRAKQDARTGRAGREHRKA
jgi:hypothetical protein